ncbi:MAG TPA: hypothetical protein VGJ84_00025 [Polyangiaceae bacterium]
MQTNSVELTVMMPASFADADAAERKRVLLVLDAMRSERITWRAAAATLGIAPERLLDLAREHGVPVVRYESTDLHDDLTKLAKLERGRAPGARSSSQIRRPCFTSGASVLGRQAVRYGAGWRGSGSALRHRDFAAACRLVVLM